MRDPIILLVHLIATLARLMGPGGLRHWRSRSAFNASQLAHRGIGTKKLRRASDPCRGRPRRGILATS